MFMNANRRLSYLQRNGVLSVLSDADRVAILRQARITELRRRQRIYHPGEPANELYLQTVLHHTARFSVVDTGDSRRLCQLDR